MNILIIDDEELIVELLRDFLSGADHQIFLAGDGLKGVSYLEKGNRFDLIILDWVIPQFGGKPLLDHLYENYPEIPILVISGAPDKAHACLAYSNVFEFIQKPFTLDDIRKNVEKSKTVRVNPNER